MKPEDICSKVNKDIRPQAETLAKAVFAMQAKIDQQIPIYEQMPLAQQVTVGTGEKMLRANPAVQEFRATVREYAQALNNLQQLVGDADVAADPEPAENVIKLLGNSRWKKRA